MTERDRLWQSFLRLKSTREATVADVMVLCRWWWMRGLVEDVRREPVMHYIPDMESVSAEEFEMMSARAGVR